MKISISILVCSLVTMGSRVLAGDFTIDTKVVLGFDLGRNMMDTTLKYDQTKKRLRFDLLDTLDRDYTDGRFYASTNMEYAPLDWLLVGTTLDTGVWSYEPLPRTITRQGLELATMGQDYHWTLEGMDIETAAAKVPFVREVYAEITPWDFLTLSGGKQEQSIGDDLFYDDYGFFVDIDFSPNNAGWIPMDVDLVVTWPQAYIPDVSPTTTIIQAKVAWVRSPLENVWVAFDHYWDHSGTVGGLMGDLLAQDLVNRGLYTQALYVMSRDITAPFQISFVQAGFTLEFQGIIWHATGIYQWGGGRLKRSDTTIRIDQHGGAVRLDAQVPAGKAVITPFFLWVQGTGSRPKQQNSSIELPLFISLVPYCGYTNIFLSGGLDTNLATRNSTLIGLGGKGLIGGGFQVAIDVTDTLEITSNSGLLFSDKAATDTGGRVYGWEQDVTVEWSPWELLTLSAEADVLMPSTFFQTRTPVLFVSAQTRLSF